MKHYLPLLTESISPIEKDIIRITTNIRKLPDSHRLTTGGNCGTFALALIKYLANKYPSEKKNFSISILSSNYKNGQEFDKDLFHGEPIIYHTYLDYNGTHYDIDGERNKRQILQFALKQYDEQDPGIFEFSFKEITKEFITALRNNTNFTVDVPMLHELISKAGSNEIKATKKDYVDWSEVDED